MDLHKYQDNAIQPEWATNLLEFLTKIVGKRGNLGPTYIFLVSASHYTDSGHAFLNCEFARVSF